MEKIIHKQLMDFIEVNDILSDSQYGFRKERSTVQAVHNLTEEINIAFNKSLFSVAIYIDFKKAFDCVQYPVLLLGTTTKNSNSIFKAMIGLF